MIEPRLNPYTDQSRMRVVHLSLVGGLAAFAALTLVLSGGEPPDSPVSQVPAVVSRLIGYALLVGLTIAVLLCRRRITRLRTGTDRDDWWRVNASTSVVLWSAALGAGFWGILAGWLTGDKTLHVLSALVGLACLLWFHPGRLERSG